MDIGEEKKKIVVEPAKDPVPRREPRPVPEPREPVPAEPREELNQRGEHTMTDPTDTMTAEDWDAQYTLERLEQRADFNRSFMRHSRRPEDMPDMRHCLDADECAEYGRAYERVHGLPVSWAWPS